MSSAEIITQHASVKQWDSLEEIVPYDRHTKQVDFDWFEHGLHCPLEKKKSWVLVFLSAQRTDQIAHAQSDHCVHRSEGIFS